MSQGVSQRLVLDRFLPYRLSVASNAVSARIARTYRKRFGLKLAEWRLIAILAEAGPLTPGALGERTRMDKITVHRAATALAVRALVRVEDNLADRRSHFLALSDEGRGLYEEIAPLALATEAALFAGFTPDERAVLDRLLRRVETAAGGVSW